MLRKQFRFLYSSLETETSFTDVASVQSLFLGHHDKVLKHKSTIEQKTFNNLKDKKPEHDPQKIVFSYSSFVLLETERSLLLKGLNFYQVSFEIFNRDIRNLEVLSVEDLDFIKARTKDIVLSSFHLHNSSVPQHLS